MHLVGHVYLTVDDGPDPVWTPRILDVLERYRATATFFTIGRAVARHPALVRRLVTAGHLVGNHTWSHRHPWLLSAAGARQEVRDGAAAIADATGLAPRVFRPPHGRLRPCMRDEARAGGQRTVLWSLSAVDWGPFGIRSCIAARLERARAGDVMLVHDGRPHINRPAALLAALPGVLEILARRGLATAPLCHASR